MAGQAGHVPCHAVDIVAQETDTHLPYGVHRSQRRGSFSLIGCRASLASVFPSVKWNHLGLL
jgi:hypothetical protein